MEKYTLIIYNKNVKKNTEEVFITKDYCYLSKNEFKIHSSALFLLSLEKNKKNPDKDLINKLEKLLITDLDIITINSFLYQYLGKIWFVKDFYGNGGRIYKLTQKQDEK
jgi:hypothetical protein